MSKNLQRAEIIVAICQGGDCKKAGAKGLRRDAKQQLRDAGLLRRSIVLGMKCTGNCKRAPICGVLPQGGWIERADDASLHDLIARAIAAAQEPA